MRLCPPFVVPLAALVLVTSTPARASEDADDDGRGADAPAQRLFVEATLGTGTPVGWAGGSVVVFPWPSFALHGGAGAGSQGLQFEAGARARFTSRPTRYGVGASWSTGPFVGVASQTFPIPEMSVPVPYMLHWERAHFANVEVSIESDSTRTMLRGFVGLGWAINGGDATVLGDEACARKSCSPILARLLPFLGVSFAFGVL